MLLASAAAKAQIQPLPQEQAVSPLALPVATSPSKNVEIIVNPTLYASGQITDSINQYMIDVTRQGYNPILVTTNFGNDSLALRNHLASKYNTDGLAGAVFVGNLPVCTYVGPASPPSGFSANEVFPTDYYFEDLNGTWSDTNSDGKLDSHTGNVAPEIWLGRLSVSSVTSLQSNRTEAGLLNAYFTRNHAYRTSQLSLAPNALAYIDDDWAPWANTWGSNAGSSVSGTLTTVSDGAATTAADYKNRLSSTAYEELLLAAHSSVSSHSFKIGSNWTGGTMYSNEIALLNPQVFFYNLFACSGARYTDYGCSAAEYTFGTNTGLLSVGSTKTGGMLDYSYYYTPLCQGNTFGDSLKAWWNYEATYGFGDYGVSWFYGMTMLGDPLLTSQAYRQYITQSTWQIAPGTTGDWATASNWTPNTPNTVLDAVINNSGTARITTVASAAAVLVGSTSQGTLEISGGSLIATLLSAGGAASSSGTVNHNSGTASFTGDVFLGSGTGSTGRYTIGGGSLQAANLYVAIGGSGTFAHNSGSVSVGGQLAIAQNAGSTGTYTLGGGSLNVRDLLVAPGGTGTLNITNSAAALTVGGRLSFGGAASFSAVSGSTIRLTGTALENTSKSSSSLSGLSNLTLVVDGGPGVTATLEAAGSNAPLYLNNFALGALQVGSATTIGSARLVNAASNHTTAMAEAFHAGNVVVNAGSTLDLNGQTLYYHDGVNLGGTVNINGGQLVHESPTTLRVYLETDRVGDGDYAVRIYGQILGGFTGEGISDLAVTLYTPGSTNVTLPKKAGTGSFPSVVTTWGPDVGDALQIRAAAVDFYSPLDPDDDLDAVETCLGTLDPGDLGTTSFLIATQTWRMLSPQMVNLAVDIATSSSHWNTLSGQRIGFDSIETIGATVGPAAGDFNGDAIVNAADVDLLYANLSGSLTYDLNHDGTVTRSDVTYLVNNILQRKFGDTNLDGRVNFNDFQPLIDNWLQPAGWARGNFDGNEKVSFLDFQYLIDNWSPAGYMPAPEPATLAMLLIGFAGLTRRKR